MKPLRLRLEEERKRLGIPWDVLERDYLISWILAGISHIDALRETLVFKGGTALKKCYFGDYRFSEDLDFSSFGKAPTGAELERAMRDAGDMAARLLDDFFDVKMLSYVEKTWEQWLGPLVPGLPSFDTVINTLRPQIAALVKKNNHL